MKCTNTFYPPLLSILRMGSVCVETRCMGVFGAVSRDTWLRVSATRSQEERAAFACYFPLGQSQILILGKYTPPLLSQRGRGGWCRLLSLRTESRYIRKPVRPSHACMFACSLQLTVCVRASVFKEIAAVKNSLCQIGGTLCGMFNIFCGESSILNYAKTWTCSTMMLHIMRHKLETHK